MGITAAFVLFAVIWFMTFLIVLPLRLKTQGDVGEVVPGTHKSAPADAQIGKRARITTLITAVLWVLIAGSILYSGIGVRDLDWFDRMPERTAD
jgi:predicted secreted protein